MRDTRLARLLASGPAGLPAAEAARLRARVERRLGFAPRPRPVVPYPVLAAGFAAACALLWFSHRSSFAPGEDALLAGGALPSLDLAAPRGGARAALREPGLAGMSPRTLAEFHEAGDLARVTVAGFSAATVRATGGSEALRLESVGTDTEPLEVRVAVPESLRGGATLTAEVWTGGELLVGAAADLVNGGETPAAPVRRITPGSWRLAVLTFPAEAVRAGGGVAAVRLLLSGRGAAAIRRVSLWRKEG